MTSTTFLERPKCNYIQQDCVCMYVTDIEEYRVGGDDSQHLRVFGITDRENSIVLYVEKCLKYVDIELSYDCTDHTIDGMLRNKAISNFNIEQISSDQNFERPLRVCCSNSATFSSIVSAVIKLQSRGFIKFYVVHDIANLFFQTIKTRNQCVHFMMSKTKQPSPYESRSQINRVINFDDLFPCVCTQQFQTKYKLRMLTISLSMKSNRKEISEIGLAYTVKGDNHKLLIQTVESSIVSQNGKVEPNYIIKVLNEKCLLNIFSQFYTTYDPDIIIGYNLTNDIIPIIDSRCKSRGIEKWSWSRLWLRYIPRKIYYYVTRPSIKFAAHSGRVIIDMSILGNIYGGSSASMNENAANEKIKMLKRCNCYCADIALTCLELFQTDYLIKVLNNANQSNVCVSKLYTKNVSI